MITFSVETSSLEVARFMNILDGIEAGALMPNTVNALHSSAALTQKMWQNWAMGNSLNSVPTIEGIPKIKHPSGKLAQSIKLEVDGPFDIVVYTKSNEMKKIEKGKPSIDMKDINECWLQGKKTRMTKGKGFIPKHPYLIIPFSWQASGSKQTNIVPVNIVEIFKKRSKSAVMTAAANSYKFEENVHGQMIPRTVYSWGGRISEDEASHTDINGNLTGYDVGMVKMKSSQYFTFRVLSPFSNKDKWIRKPVEPIDVVGALSNQIKPVFENAVAEALRADLNL